MASVRDSIKKQERCAIVLVIANGLYTLETWKQSCSHLSETSPFFLLSFSSLLWRASRNLFGFPVLRWRTGSVADRLWVSQGMLRLTLMGMIHCVIHPRSSLNGCSKCGLKSLYKEDSSLRTHQTSLVGHTKIWRCIFGSLSCRFYYYFLRSIRSP